MALNNLVDTKSGMDCTPLPEYWKTFGERAPRFQQLETCRISRISSGKLASLLKPNYFGGKVINPAYNSTQAVYAMDSRYSTTTGQTRRTHLCGNWEELFFNPQYGALAAISSIGSSWYNAGTLSVRERLGSQLTMDFNYTYSHSMDDFVRLAEFNQYGGYGANFILNPISNQLVCRLRFRHSTYCQLQHRLGSAIRPGPQVFFRFKGLANALIGGWQLSGIMRWNSGLPFVLHTMTLGGLRTGMHRATPSELKPIQACPTRGGIDAPKLFGCDPKAAYDSFRNAKPGETGDRSPFRLPGFFTLDMGVVRFTIPGTEKQKLQLRFEYSSD